MAHTPQVAYPGVPQPLLVLAHTLLLLFPLDSSLLTSLSALLCHCRYAPWLVHALGRHADVMWQAMSCTHLLLIYSVTNYTLIYRHSFVIRDSTASYLNTACLPQC